MLVGAAIAGVALLGPASGVAAEQVVGGGREPDPSTVTTEPGRDGGRTDPGGSVSSTTLTSKGTSSSGRSGRCTAVADAAGSVRERVPTLIVYDSAAGPPAATSAPSELGLAIEAEPFNVQAPDAEGRFVGSVQGLDPDMAVLVLVPDSETKALVDGWGDELTIVEVVPTAELQDASVLAGSRAAFVDRASARWRPKGLTVDRTRASIDATDRPRGIEVPLGELTLTTPGASQPIRCEGDDLGLPISVDLTGVGLDEVTVSATTMAGVALDESVLGAEGDQGVPDPSVTSSTTAPDGGAVAGADEDEDQDDDGDDAATPVRSSSSDDGGGVPIAAVVVGLLVAAGIVGLVVARRSHGGAAEEVVPPWPGTGPSAPAAVAGPVRAGPPALGASRIQDAPGIAPLDLLPAAPGWTAAVPFGAAVRLNDLGLMRLLPTDGPAGRVWSSSTTSAIATAGWLEKKVDRGEDAEPTLRLHESGRGLVAVYDGTGGAGAGIARRLRDGTELTGAYVAARLARDLTEAWFSAAVDQGRASTDADALASWLAAALRDEAAFVPDTSASLRGKLSRILPTTLAAVAYAPASTPGAIVADSLWAGDSRVYVLTPTDGLQVLSVDDTRETDALALIRNDQPMDNLVSADRAFRVNHHRVEVSGPAVLLTATDGCFGYLRTPAHFEYLLLHLLGEATDAADWSSRVIEALAAFTADDASFALSAVGFEDFDDLRTAFAARLAEVADEHWRPFQEAQDAGEAEALRARSWATYRDRYHARILAPAP